MLVYFIIGIVFTMWVFHYFPSRGAGDVAAWFYFVGLWPIVAIVLLGAAIKHRSFKEVFARMRRHKDEQGQLAKK